MAEIDMEVCNSQIYSSDILRVVGALSALRLPCNKTILVTGATGLICSAVVDVLAELSILRNLNWNIIIAARNVQKAKERFSRYEEKSNISYFRYDISDSCDFPNGINYIIHGAGNAYPALYSEKPAETLSTSVKGIEDILRYSVANKTRILYVSSSEVYGRLQNIKPIKENEYGYIDILNPRSSYSMGKRAGETLCASFVSEFGTDCVIVRPGHVYGPTASLQDNRVSSSFMYAASHGQNLVMKSDGEQIRSYCYCLDCASAIVTALFMGESGEAYNISNRDSICTIKEMAECFSKAGGVDLHFDLPSEKERRAFNPMINSSLNSKKLESLGWKAVFSKEEGFEHSVNIIREIL